MSRHEIKNTLIFDSVHDAAVYAERPRVEESVNSSEKSEGHEWAFGLTLKETLHLAKTGAVWREGVDRISNALEITERLTAKHDLPGVKFDIVGGNPSVGRYLSGHPRNMRRRMPLPNAGRPTLSIGIPMGIAWMTRAEERLNMGAAMISVVRALEHKGYRCEMTALWRASTQNNSDKLSTGRWINIEVRLKTAAQRFNPATMAFMIAHPASTRRMMWRIAEAHQGMVEKGVGSWYCDNSESRVYEESMSSDFDIYFQNMIGTQQRRCRTPEGAYEYVKEVVEAQLKMAAQAKKDFA